MNKFAVLFNLIFGYFFFQIRNINVFQTIYM